MGVRRKKAKKPCRSCSRLDRELRQALAETAAMRDTLAYEKRERASSMRETVELQATLRRIKGGLLVALDVVKQEEPERDVRYNDGVSVQEERNRIRSMVRPEDQG